MIDHWSVSKIKRMGADAVKVLAWYRPDGGKNILKAQHDYVQRIGEECAKHDILFDGTPPYIDPLKRALRLYDPVDK